jgi:hypothetical protein
MCSTFLKKSTHYFINLRNISTIEFPKNIKKLFIENSKVPKRIQFTQFALYVGILECLFVKNSQGI